MYLYLPVILHVKDARKRNGNARKRNAPNQNPLIEEHTAQWSNIKGQATIYKTYR